jgi:hypothetical protein
VTARRAAGAAVDPLDGGRKLRAVGSGAVFDVVVEDDAVVVVGDLGFVPELDGLRSVMAVAGAPPAARTRRAVRTSLPTALASSPESVG